MISTCRRKQYVEVVATHYIDGGVRPQKIVLATGQVYDVEDSREASKIKGRETCLYEASGRWFVEMKA